MKNICIIGSGGHAHSLLSLIQRSGLYQPIGFLDSFRSVGSHVYGLPILGGIDDIAELKSIVTFDHVVIAIGDNYRRKLLTKKVKSLISTISFPSLVDPTAILSSNVTICQGAVIMAQAYVGPGSVLGQGALLNTKASLDHDCTMKPFSSLAPGVITGGFVRIGSCASLGIGSTIIQRVHIGTHTVIGANSLVLRDVPSSVLTYGSPARVIRRREKDETYL